jgi:hypothetical protein
MLQKETANDNYKHIFVHQSYDTSKGLWRRCFTCIKVAHTVNLFCLLLLYIYIYCLIMKLQPASERVCWNKWDGGRAPMYVFKIKRNLNAKDSQNQEWDESYTFADCGDKWLLLIHRFHRQVNVADPKTSDSWTLHIHRYLRQLDAASTDIWHS